MSEATKQKSKPKKASKKEAKINPMREVLLDKVSVNIGVGEAGDKLEKAVKLMELLSGQKPVKTKSNKRIPSWGVRPGLSVGCKTTVRGKKAVELLKRLLESVDFKLRESNFDVNGNLNFGIRSYIEIPGMKYEPSIGVFGLSVTAVLKRRGYRVKLRKLHKARVGGSHAIVRSEGVDYFKKNFKVEVK